MNNYFKNYYNENKDTLFQNQKYVNKCLSNISFIKLD